MLELPAYLKLKPRAIDIRWIKKWHKDLKKPRHESSEIFTSVEAATQETGQTTRKKHHAENAVTVTSERRTKNSQDRSFTY